jgi:hypothetical protein
MARRRLPIPEITKILILLTAAVMIILSKDTCGKAVQNLFNVVAPPVAAGPDAGQSRR